MGLNYSHILIEDDMRVITFRLTKSILVILVTSIGSRSYA